MDYSVFSQIAVGTAAVLTLGFVVKISIKKIGELTQIFLQRLKERDDFLEKLIDNHFKHHNEGLAKMTEAINRLVDRL